MTKLRHASSNRIVVTLTEQVESMGEYRFAEEASNLLGMQVRVYYDAVLSNPGVSPDVLAAAPL